MASGNTLLVFTARDGVPSATSGAAHGILAGAASPAEGVPYLAFDSATAEYADFQGVLPRNYASGGLTLTLHWARQVTTNNTVWNAAFRRVQDDAEDLDTTAHSYDYNAVTATTASAAGGGLRDRHLHGWRRHGLTRCRRAVRSSHQSATPRTAATR